MKSLIMLLLVVGLIFCAAFVVVEPPRDHHGPRGEQYWDGPAPKHHHPPKAKKGHPKPKAEKAPEPPEPPADDDAEAPAPASSSETRTIVGRVSATEDRARADARRELEVELSKWLEPEVPSTWTPKPPTAVTNEKVTAIDKPYGTVYTAQLDADFSAAHRAEMVRSYNRTVARDRTMKLGGLLGFALVCLAAVTGYIRADEATRGYHTNRLRLLAAAGVGAAGALIYQLLA